MSDSLDALRDLAERRRVAVLALAEARDELRGQRPELERLVHAAHAAGCGKVEIARAAGVVRQTVYDILAG